MTDFAQEGAERSPIECGRLAASIRSYKIKGSFRDREAAECRRILHGPALILLAGRAPSLMKIPRVDTRPGSEALPAPRAAARGSASVWKILRGERF